MRKTRIISSILSILLIISMMGCTKTSIPIKSKDDLQGTLTVWSTGNNAKALSVTGENFTKKHPLVKVIVSDIGKDELYQKLNSGLLKNDGLPDVVSLESQSLAYYGKTFPNKFLDLTNEVSSIKENFLKSKLQEVTIDGKIMALPWESAPSALFYRSDIFKEAGVNAEDIKTWNDYIEAGKKINSFSKGKIKMLAFDANKDDLLYNQLLNQLGSWYFDKDGKLTVFSVEAINAMSMVKEIYNSNIALNCKDSNSIISAAVGSKIATLPYEANFVGTLKEEGSSLNGKWAVMKFPDFEAGGKTDATLGGTVLTVTSMAKDKKLAVEFAKFAATDSDSLLTGLSKNYIFPSYIPVYDDFLFQTPESYFQGQKIWRLFSIIAKGSISRNFTENYNIVDENIKNVEQNILKGEDVNKGMEDAQLNILNALKASTK